MVYVENGTCAGTFLGTCAGTFLSTCAFCKKVRAVDAVSF